MKIVMIEVLESTQGMQGILIGSKARSLKLYQQKNASEQ